jgi:hypothetical protein
MEIYVNAVLTGIEPKYGFTETFVHGAKKVEGCALLHNKFNFFLLSHSSIYAFVF